MNGHSNGQSYNGHGSGNGVYNKYQDNGCLNWRKRIEDKINQNSQEILYLSIFVRCIDQDERIQDMDFKLDLFPKYNSSLSFHQFIRCCRFHAYFYFHFHFPFAF